MQPSLQRPALFFCGLWSFFFTRLGFGFISKATRRVSFPSPSSERCSASERPPQVQIEDSTEFQVLLKEEEWACSRGLAEEENKDRSAGVSIASRRTSGLTLTTCHRLRLASSTDQVSACSIADANRNKKALLSSRFRSRFSISICSLFLHSTSDGATSRCNSVTRRFPFQESAALEIYRLKPWLPSLLSQS